MKVVFSKGIGNKKYKAKIYNSKGDKIKTIQFGDVNYEHYKDNVLGLYSHLDHMDKDRRKEYRKRHSKIKTKEGKLAYKIKYSPAWFSYIFLW